MRKFIIFLIASFLSHLSFADTKDCINAFTARNINDAITCTTQEIDKSPKDANLYILRGSMYTSSNQVEPAIQDFSLAIKLDPRSINAYSLRANAYLFTEKYLMAISDLSNAIKLDQGKNPLFSTSLLAQRAATYQKLGIYKNAIIDYSDALKRLQHVPDSLWNEPQNKQYELKKGIYLDVHLGLCTSNINIQKFSDAKPHCLKAAELDTKSNVAKINLASVYIELKEYSDAIATLTKIPKTELEKDFSATYNMAVAYLRLFQQTKSEIHKESAKTYFKQANLMAKTEKQLEMLRKISE